MQKPRFFLRLLSLVFFVTFGSQGLSVPLIATSVRPVGALIQEICQTDCEVSSFIPGGKSEHTWSPTPKDIIKFSKAVLGVGVGLDFDERLFKTILPAAEKCLVLFIGPQAHPQKWRKNNGGKHDHEHHDHGEFDPHIWLDPIRMADSVPKILESLLKVLPDAAERLRNNAKRVESELRDLDKRLLIDSKDWPKDKIIVLHDAFSYFSDRYKLNVWSIEGGGSGNELSASVFAATLRELRSVKVVGILVEREDGSVKNLARELKTKAFIFDFGMGPTTVSYIKWIESLSVYFKSLSGSNQP